MDRARRRHGQLPGQDRGRYRRERRHRRRARAAARRATRQARARGAQRRGARARGRGCRALGAAAHAVPTDVADDGACARLMAATVDAHGGIDALVANAGMSMHARFSEITDFSTFERLWRINCLGTVQCVRHAYPHLKTRRGQVVGVCSLAGKTGVPERTTYCASKFAQAGFLDALRIEAEDDGIAVTVVFPGVVATETRRRGFNAHGQPAGVSGLTEDQAMPVDECAAADPRGDVRPPARTGHDGQGARRPVDQDGGSAGGRPHGARRPGASRRGTSISARLAPCLSLLARSALPDNPARDTRPMDCPP